MTKKIGVWLHTEEIVQEKLANACAVVFDVLLATTTLITIVENGAKRVRPVATIEEAWSIRQAWGEQTLLGGEQQAKRVPGFDCGPYPSEYPIEKVQERDVVFLSTNGTRAIAAASPAREVLLGGVRNAPTLASYLVKCPYEQLYLIAAGSRGHLCVEDFLGVAITLAYMEDLDDTWQLNDGAQVAAAFGRQHQKEVAEWIRAGRVGRWFAEYDPETLAFASDVGASSTLARLCEGMLEALQR
ncbi:MAG: 2-phosphosulfolactate phosphatase [Firmicutes bacterium]|nr:2-phosphosulfolactate phosphatase [Bacillota bacterium]